MKNLALLFSIIVLASGICLAQTSAFTYQGKLSDGGTPANGVYDMQFKLYNTAGALQGSANTVTNPTVQVVNGIFTVQLDFGATGFPGDDRFLGVSGTE